jgi:hypothetical protein
MSQSAENDAPVNGCGPSPCPFGTPEAERECQAREAAARVIPPVVGQP